MAKFRVNGLLAKQAREELGYTSERFAPLVGLSPRQLSRLENGSSTDPALIELWEEQLRLPPGSLKSKPTTLQTLLGHEWNVDRMRKAENDRTAPNGLRYEIFKVPSHIHPGRWGRLKRYDTTRLADLPKKKTRAILNRHSVIAYRLGNTPYITPHLTSGQDESLDAWWVLDEWIAGETLEKLFDKRAVSKEGLIQLMANIVEALAALHAQEIIRRELTPRSVIVQGSTDIPILTDFELGKLLEGVPTVRPSKKWRSTPYLATEVIAGAQVTPAADWFSWASIFVHGLSGKPAQSQEEFLPAIQQANIHSSLQKILLRCVDLHPEKRPQHKEIARTLRKEMKH